MLGGYAGGQAEYARVPYADVGPLKIDDALAEGGGGEDVQKREHDVRADRTRQRCLTQSPGDVNADCAVSVNDVFFLINYLFLDGPPPHGPAGMASGEDDVGQAALAVAVDLPELEPVSAAGRAVAGDLDVRDGRLREARYKLLPVFSNLILADPAMTERVGLMRASTPGRLCGVLS